jgi:hypothetical protein
MRRVAGDLLCCSLLSLAFCAILGETSATSLAATPTPPPTATPTIMPAASIPASPSDVGRQGDVLYWVDNSSNEDGFEIDLTICGTPFHFVVGANTTSFPLPPEVLSSQTGLDPQGGFCNYVSYSVTAFNQAGRSQPAGFGIVIEPPPPLATPSPIRGPSTGSPPRAEGPPLTYLLEALGTMAILIGVALRKRATAR